MKTRVFSKALWSCFIRLCSKMILIMVHVYIDPFNWKVTVNNERGWKCRFHFFILSFTTQILNVSFLVSLLFRRSPSLKFSPNTHPHAPYTVCFVAKNRGLSADYWTCWGRCLAFSFFNDAVLSSNIFHEMSFNLLLLHAVFHSFICLRDIASYIKVRIQSTFNRCTCSDFVIFLWKMKMEYKYVKSI